MEVAAALLDASRKLSDRNVSNSDVPSSQTTWSSSVNEVKLIKPQESLLSVLSTPVYLKYLKEAAKNILTCFNLVAFVSKIVTPSIFDLNVTDPP